MTNATKPDADLIRALITQFIDHPDNLRIDIQEYPEPTRWTIQSDAEDLPKLVGRSGAHFYALKTLIAEMGKAQDQQYVLGRYPEPLAVQQGRPRQPRKTATREYDPRPARDLLQRLLERIGLGQFDLELMLGTGADRHTYQLNIYPRDPEDYQTLTVPTVTPRDPNPMSPIGALGTLYRAWANRDGVNYSLEIIRPQ